MPSGSSIRRRVCGAFPPARPAPLREPSRLVVRGLRRDPIVPDSDGNSIPIRLPGYDVSAFSILNSGPGAGWASSPRMTATTETPVRALIRVTLMLLPATAGAWLDGQPNYGQALYLVGQMLRVSTMELPPRASASVWLSSSLSVRLRITVPDLLARRQRTHVAVQPTIR